MFHKYLSFLILSTSFAAKADTCFLKSQEIDRAILSAPFTAKTAASDKWFTLEGIDQNFWNSSFSLESSSKKNSADTPEFPSQTKKSTANTPVWAQDSDGISHRISVDELQQKPLKWRGISLNEADIQDVSFLKKLLHVRILSIRNTFVHNLDVLKDHPALKNISITIDGKSKGTPEAIEEFSKSLTELSQSKTLEHINLTKKISIENKAPSSAPISTSPLDFPDSGFKASTTNTNYKKSLGLSLQNIFKKVSTTWMNRDLFTSLKTPLNKLISQVKIKLFGGFSSYNPSYQEKINGSVLPNWSEGEQRFDAEEPPLNSTYLNSDGLQYTDL